MIFRQAAVLFWRKFKKNMRREDGVIYQTRYHLLKTKWLSIYVNVIRTPDYDPWFHNHPWRRSYSVKLRHDYTEEVSFDGRGADKGWWGGTRYRRPGRFSRIPEYHRIVQLHGPHGAPVTTLFIGWRSDRPWGFVNPDTGELVSWQERVRLRGMTPEESRRL